MVYCIISGDPITKKTNSRAHVIPSALGGRLKPLGLLTNSANTALNEKVDLPLVNALQPLMVLLGGNRDRGTNPAIKMKDKAGVLYLLSFGKPLMLAKPDYKVTPITGSTNSFNVQIKARTQKELRSLLKRARTQFPGMNLEITTDAAEMVHKEPAGMLSTRLQIGPASVFPAAFVAASIFCAYHQIQPHPDLKAYVDRVDPSAVPVLLPPDTYYWYPPEQQLDPHESRVCHRLILLTDPNRKQAFVHVTYFDIVCIGVVLPYEGADQRLFSYGIDILRGTEFVHTVDEVFLGSAVWAATHILGDPALYDIIQRRTSRVVALAQERERSAVVDQLVNETLGPLDGRPLTPAHLKNISGKVAELVLRAMRQGFS